MPIYIRTLGYKIYIWSNEKDEPIHFHITKENPSENDTKVWVLANGSFEIAHNKGRIPEKDLSRILTAMQVYYFDLRFPNIVTKFTWQSGYVLLIACWEQGKLGKNHFVWTENLSFLTSVFWDRNSKVLAEKNLV